MPGPDRSGSAAGRIPAQDADVVPTGMMEAAMASLRRPTLGQAVIIRDAVEAAWRWVCETSEQVMKEKEKEKN